MGTDPRQMLPSWKLIGSNLQVTKHSEFDENFTVVIIIIFLSMYNKTVIRFGFCDIQNNQGLGEDYQPQPSASAGYHNNLIQ